MMMLIMLIMLMMLIMLISGLPRSPLFTVEGAQIVVFDDGNAGSDGAGLSDGIPPLDAKAINVLS